VSAYTAPMLTAPLPNVSGLGGSQFTAETITWVPITLPMLMSPPDVSRSTSSATSLPPCKLPPTQQAYSHVTSYTPASWLLGNIPLPGSVTANESQEHHFEPLDLGSASGASQAYRMCKLPNLWPRCSLRKYFRQLWLDATCIQVATPTLANPRIVTHHAR
jgi:hypothetical protein